MVALLIILLVVIIIGCIVKYSLYEGHDDKQSKSSPSVSSSVESTKVIPTTVGLTQNHNLIEDFFKIDIRDIFKYQPKFLYEKENECIKKLNEEIKEEKCKVIDKHYDLRLKELELGTFYKIEITQSHDDSYWLTFEGRDYRLTKELHDFINFCFDKYGYDDLGNGIITSEDFILISSNRFVRMWDDVYLTNIEGGVMTMRIYIDNSKNEIL